MWQYYRTSRLCWRRPSEAFHQYCLGSVFRLPLSGSCVSSSEKLMNFIHFHNSCTQKCDHHILLIMPGNADKESCHKLLSLILVREQGLFIIKTDCSCEMMVAVTIKEKNYLMVSLFCQLVLPLSYLYLWY